MLGEAGPETVLALASLKRRGYAVTAVLVVFTETELEDAYARLFAAGIDVLPLKSEAELPWLCRQQAVR